MKVVCDQMKKNSRLPSFHKICLDERLEVLKRFAGLSSEEIALLKQGGALDLEIAEMMIENVVGTTQFPVGIATNFLINGKDFLIPMAIEEPSVVAAASHAAKLCRDSGGFITRTDKPVMIGQVQLVGISDMAKAKRDIVKNKEKLLKIMNRKDSVMCSLGGGAFDLELNELDTFRGKMLIVNLFVDVRDAMGANCVNALCETVAPHLEEITYGTARLRIVSNLATRRLVSARTTWKRDAIGEDLIEGILDAYAFAVHDVHRRATHNKGVMNGIDAVIIATGNDWRAVESGAHSYSAYMNKPLTHYEKNENGDLVGSIELPLAVGLVGGATKSNPISRILLKVLGVQTASELAEIVACVGLANNFAALRALVKEGIQKGHMKLHAKNIALMAGAKPNEVDKIVRVMIEEDCISLKRATEILQALRMV